MLAAEGRTYALHTGDAADNVHQHVTSGCR